MWKTLRTRRQRIVTAGLALLLVVGVCDIVGADGRDDDRPRHDLNLIGLTEDGRLVSFRARSPHRTKDIGYVSGLNLTTGQAFSLGRLGDPVVDIAIPLTQ